jgi:hypothetical protein
VPSTDRASENAVERLRGRVDEAREAYGAGIGQAEKFGHSGMAEDLRLAQVQLGG